MLNCTVIMNIFLLYLLSSVCAKDGVVGGSGRVQLSATQPKRCKIDKISAERGEIIFSTTKFVTNRLLERRLSIRS
jgi:hypothetical protein